MKESDREYIFTGIARMCQSLMSEADILCELIDEEADVDSVARHMSSLEDEADNISRDIQYYYQENRLYRDADCMMLLDIVNSIEKCTDLIYDVAKTFIRYNVYEVKDSIVSSFMSSGTGAVKMAEVMNKIRKMNKGDVPVRDLIELDNYSVEYMKIYELNMRKLCVNGADPLEVIRWIAVYDAFKKLFEAYEDVAEVSGKYCLFMD